MVVGWAVGWATGCLLACVSIFLVASSRLATCVARIEEVFCITPFSVYSLNISIKSRSFVCSCLRLDKEHAFIKRSLACRTSSCERLVCRDCCSCILGSLFGCSDWPEGVKPLFRVSLLGRRRVGAVKFCSDPNRGSLLGSACI